MRLQTGELIVVGREFRWGGSGDPSVSHGPLYYASIDFDYRGKKYHWDGKGLWPIILQVDASGNPVVVSIIAYCTIWNERGKPDSQYVFDGFVGGKWEQLPSAPMSVSLDSNLSNGSDGKKFLGESDNRIKDNFLIPEFFKKVSMEKPIGC